MASILAPPLGRLADDLSNLRLRVREAMASEVARAVGEAAREAVALALSRGDPAPRPAPARQAPEWGGYGHGPGLSRDDDPDPWARDPRWHDEADDWSEAPASALQPESAPPTPASPLRRGSAALAAGWGAGRWWFSRRGSLPEAVAVGLLAALAALTGGDATRR